MTYIFAAVDNPHPDVLREINPAIDVPVTYVGLNRNTWLAEIFNRLVISGAYPDVAAIAANTGSAYEAERLAGLDGFVALAQRYGVAKPEFLYYNFTHVLDMADQDNWYYILYLAVYYGERTIPLATTLMQLINAEEPGKKRIPVVLIDQFMETNKYLRQEGIILPLQELYAFAKQWGKDDAYILLSNKIKLREANKYAKAGFTDANSIVSSHKFIPASMIDDLINPKPLPQVSDD